jgi:hypothetical protein
MMAAPRELPLEARRAAWDALWRILLVPRPNDIRSPTEPPDDATTSIDRTAR